MNGNKALCIGVNNYPGSGMDLAGCVNDALDWGVALDLRGFCVRYLLDTDATGAIIRAEIEDDVAKMKTGDTYVITFSGHGTFVPDEDGDEPDGQDEAICPWDVVEKGPIVDDELYELYSKRAWGSRLVIISDSCFSGTVSRFNPVVTPPTMLDLNKLIPQRLVRFMPPTVFLRDGVIHPNLRHRGAPPGRYEGLLMAGCQDWEYSYDAWFNGRPNGAFTYVALQTLKTLPPGATYLDWHRAIRKVLPSQQYPQAPNLFGTRHRKGWPALV